MTNPSSNLVARTRILLPIATATLAVLGLALALGAVLDCRIVSAAQQPAAPAPRRPTASVNQQPRVDVLGMTRPIDMHDSRLDRGPDDDGGPRPDQGGEDDGADPDRRHRGERPVPHHRQAQQRAARHGRCRSRAGLGNALVAPIVTLEPGNPERVRTPGTMLLSQETYRAVLTDMAISLKTQGFNDIVLLGDSGGNIKPMQEVADALNAKWKGSRADARTTSSPSTTTTTRSRSSRRSALGIHEKMEGLHDDYYISSIIARARPERRPRCRSASRRASSRSTASA